MTEQYNDFQRIWRLGRILQHINTPMWTNIDKKGNWCKYPDGKEILIQYSPEAIEYMQKLQNDLIEKWLQEHPAALLNKKEIQ